MFTAPPEHVEYTGFASPASSALLVTVPGQPRHGGNAPEQHLPDLTVLADRHPDERDLLAALSDVIAQGEDWMAEARRMRVYAALRLRQKGTTMTAIAEVAGVTDSYLAREVFKMGATRRRRQQGDAAGG